jgi:type IV pilus assembly protein PilX
MNEISRVKNEEGSVLIVALIVLVLLTLLGIFATRTTEVEMQIAGNDLRYKRNIYSAEAVAMECAQNIKDTAVLDTGALAWLHGMGGVSRANVLDDTFWASNSQQSTADSNTRYMAVVEGIAEQTSLDMTKSRLHMYAIYGRRHNDSNPNEGRSIVNIGYKKAF